MATALYFGLQTRTFSEFMVFKNLATFPFNNHPNIAISDGGWYVVSGKAVDALAGGDTIIGISGAENVSMKSRGVSTLDRAMTLFLAIAAETTGSIT